MLGAFGGQALGSRLGDPLAIGDFGLLWASLLAWLGILIIVSASLLLGVAMNSETVNAIVAGTAVGALVVIGLAALIVAIAVWRVGRDVRRVTRSLDEIAGVIKTDLPATLKELRTSATNLGRLSDELEPRLAKVDDLLDETAATLAIACAPRPRRPRTSCAVRQQRWTAPGARSRLPARVSPRAPIGCARASRTVPGGPAASARQGAAFAYS